MLFLFFFFLNMLASAEASSPDVFPPHYVYLHSHIIPVALQRVCVYESASAYTLPGFLEVSNPGGSCDITSTQRLPPRTNCLPNPLPTRFPLACPCCRTCRPHATLASEGVKSTRAGRSEGLGSKPGSPLPLLPSRYDWAAASCDQEVWLLSISPAG